MTRLAVHVTPRSSQNRVEWHEEILRVWLTAPPVEGAANEALIALLAARLGLPKRQVTIVRGTSGRQKLVEVSGISRDEVRQRLSKPAERS